MRREMELTRSFDSASGKGVSAALIKDVAEAQEVRETKTQRVIPR